MSTNNFFAVAIACVLMAAIFCSEAHANERETEATSKDDIMKSLAALDKVEKALRAEQANKPEEALQLRQEAIREYDEILSRNPENLKTLNLRASVKNQIQRGAGKEDSNRVIELSTRLISATASNAEAYSIRGRAYRELQMYDKAIEDYKSAISLTTDDVKKQYLSLTLSAIEIEAE